MSGIALTGLRRAAHLIGLIAGAHALLGMTCGPIAPVVDMGPNLYECGCVCGDNYGGYQDTFVFVCAYPDNVSNACSAGCPGGCVYSGNYDLNKANYCAENQEGQAVAGGQPNASEASLDPSSSLATINYWGQPATTFVRGDVKLTGGCDRGTCSISLDTVYLVPDDFSVVEGNGRETKVTDILVLNDRPLIGTQTDTFFTIPSAGLHLMVGGSTNGVSKAVALSPGQDLHGFYEPSSGRFGLYAHFAAGTNLDLTFDLQGQATSRPPVADAGAPQTVRGDPSRATVILDGTRSYDADGDLTEIAWFEGTTYLGSGERLEVVLGAGAHTLTAVALDATGKWSTAETTVTVVR